MTAWDDNRFPAKAALRRRLERLRQDSGLRRVQDRRLHAPTSPGSTASSSPPACPSTATRSRRRPRRRGSRSSATSNCSPAPGPNCRRTRWSASPAPTASRRRPRWSTTSSRPRACRADGRQHRPADPGQDPLPEGGVYVLELSSYQIDLTQSLDCDVAVLLNITPDHLDRYDSFEAYAASKLRLFEMQSRDGCRSDDACARRSRFARATPWRIMHAVMRLRRKLSSSSDWPALQGPHNRRMPRRGVGVPLLGLGDRRRSSRASAPTPASPTAWSAFAKRRRAVRQRQQGDQCRGGGAGAGGLSARALDRRRAGQGRRRWAKPRSISAMSSRPTRSARRGRCSRGCCARRGSRSTECETLEKAVKRAAEDSQSGDTVLLSPACASFDQFRDFEARGDAFRELVGAL